MELDTLVSVMIVIIMIKAELIRITLAGMRAHPFWPWQLLLDFHQYLGFRSIEGGVVVKSSLGGTLPRPSVWASLSPSPGGSLDLLSFRESSRVRPNFAWLSFLGGAAQLVDSPPIKGFIVPGF